jgi:cellulose synthase (UDP-forming)
MATSVDSASAPTSNLPGGRELPPWLRWIAPPDPASRAWLRLRLLRVVIAVNLFLGSFYVVWRYADTINWTYWWVALPLPGGGDLQPRGCLALRHHDVELARARPTPPPPPPGWTVDVFITCYNEPVDSSADRAGGRRRSATRTAPTSWTMAQRRRCGRWPRRRGIGYIVRSLEWQNRARHAKAGNLINAFYQTDGEFISILDADQIPAPEFWTARWAIRDPKGRVRADAAVLLQRPAARPLRRAGAALLRPDPGGERRWNAAFFCGSNAVLRREALMFIGLPTTCATSSFACATRCRRPSAAAPRRARSRASGEGRQRARTGLRELRGVVARGAAGVARGADPGDDLGVPASRRGDLAPARGRRSGAHPRRTGDIPAWRDADLDVGLAAVARGRGDAAGRSPGGQARPLLALATVRSLLAGRSTSTAPTRSTRSCRWRRSRCTEDMATAMRMHAQGWTRCTTARIWSSGWPGRLRLGDQAAAALGAGHACRSLPREPADDARERPVQRLMYFATMWSYLSGIFAPIYLLARSLYLFFGWLPVRRFLGRVLLAPRPLPADERTPLPDHRLGASDLSRAAIQPRALPDLDRGGLDADDQRLLGRKLDFVVTPKLARAASPCRSCAGRSPRWGLLIAAALYGLARLALGLTPRGCRSWSHLWAVTTSRC